MTGLSQVLLPGLWLSESETITVYDNDLVSQLIIFLQHNLLLSIEKRVGKLGTLLASPTHNNIFRETKIL